MRHLFCTLALFITVTIADYDPGFGGPTGISVDVGGTATLLLPQVSSYRRLVKNAKGKEIEHIYRVCTGKNKQVCGFWENTNTKKKVASGTTTYNKNKQQLIIKKVKKSDEGTYMIGNKKSKFDLFVY